MKKLLLVLITLISTQLGGCATTTSSSVAGVDRKQLLILSGDQVRSMATQAYTQTLAEADNKNTLNTNSAQLARVRNISNRLIAQTGHFRPDAREWDWEVNVQSNDQINAYAMPGGKIMVYTGLIEKLNATDAELAAVIGHEIAHALREHGRERMSIAAVQQVGLLGLAVLAGSSSNQNAAAAGVQAAALGSSLFFALPNSREQERESDRIGLELMARAGYDPSAAVSLWQKMSAASEGSPPEFLSTHPASASRIADLRALIPNVMPLYKQAKKP